MKSRFRYWAYFLAFLALGFSVILIMELTGNILNPTMPIGFFLVFTLFFIYVWIWLVFGELRTKIIYIDFAYSSFTIKRFLGLSASKSYYFDTFDGYKTSILFSQSGSYEYLYLMIGNKKIIKLSEFYHSNYKELKQFVINQNIKYLGFESYSFIKEFKEIFI